MSETPRVWVGCLGCYNAGYLVGEWFDATDAPEAMDEFSPRVFAGKVAPEGHAEEMHEELWVMDYAGFHGLLTGECSPSEARVIAEALDCVSDLDAFEVWLAYDGEGETAAEKVTNFEDAAIYAGDSFQDAAYDFLEGTGAFEGVPEFWQSYLWHMAGDWLQSSVNGGEIAERYHNGTHYIIFV